MRVQELSKDELLELKSRHYTELLDRKGESPSYGELANVETLVSDEEIYEEYDGIDFVKDDFFCNRG